MKKIWKKCIGYALTISMMLSINGCTKNDETINQTLQSEDTSEMAYEATELVMDGVQGDVCSVLVKNDKLYFKTYDEVFKDGKNGGKYRTELLKFYMANIDGSDLQEIKFELPTEEKINSVFVGENGTFTVATFFNSETGELMNGSIIKFDIFGKQLAKKNMEEMKIEKNTLVKGVLVDSNGNLILACDNHMYIFDDGFQMKGQVSIEDGWNLVDIVETRNGEIIGVENNVTVSNATVRVRVFDVEKKSFGENLDIDFSGYSGNDYIMYAADSDLYYKDNTGIYSYDIKDHKSIKKIDYSASVLTLEEADTIVPASENKFVGIVRKNINSDLGLAVYCKMNPSDLMSKTKIIYGGLWIQEDIKKAIITFNKQNKEYQIEIKDYGMEEDPVAKMNADIIAGKVPDIIDMSYTSVEKYVEMGLLEDITPYLEADLEIGSEDVIASVMEAMKINGKIYFVTPGFSIKTIVGKTKDVGKQSGWNFDEMKMALNKKGDSVSLFYDETCIGKESLLYYFLESGHMDYVDWKTGECGFNSKEFKDILEFCNGRGLKEDAVYGEEADIENVPSRIRAGEVLLYVNNGLLLEDIQTNRQIFGEDITYIGYPNKEKQGSCFEFTHQIGISSKSEVKEKAWEFVRIFLTREYQGECLKYEAIPTRQDCFDMKIKEKTTTKAYVDEFGNEIEPLDVTWFWGDVQLQNKPLSQEDVDTFISLVNNTKRTVNYDENILSIIMEEAQVYFQGDRKLNKTAKIIQKRVETYVNEQR